MFQVAELSFKSTAARQECDTTRNTSASALRVERIVLIGTAPSLATASSSTSSKASSRFQFFEVSASEANVSSCGGHGVAQLEVDSYTGRSVSLCAI